MIIGSTFILAGFPLLLGFGCEAFPFALLIAFFCARAAFNCSVNSRILLSMSSMILFIVVKINL